MRKELLVVPLLTRVGSQTGQRYTIVVRVLRGLASPLYQLRGPDDYLNDCKRYIRSQFPKHFPDVSHLTAPALVSLSYDGDACPGDEIVSFITRSKVSHSLDTLALSLARGLGLMAWYTQRSAIIQCLEIMPDLSRLSLRDTNKGEYIDPFGYLIGDIAEVCSDIKWDITSRVLPKLKHFSITGPRDMSYCTLERMVASRWCIAAQPAGGCTRLESVEVNWLGPCAHPKSSLTRLSDERLKAVGAETLARLRRYRSEGLRVVGPIDEADSECAECVALAARPGPEPAPDPED